MVLQQCKQYMVKLTGKSKAKQKNKNNKTIPAIHIMILSLPLKYQNLHKPIINQMDETK